MTEEEIGKPDSMKVRELIDAAQRVWAEQRQWAAVSEETLEDLCEAFEALDEANL